MKIDKRYILYFFIALVFGLVFVPNIIERIKSGDITRSESRSLKVDNLENKSDSLSFLIVNGKRKKVPNFEFLNQNGKIITNKDFQGKVHIVEFFFTTCTTICPIMNTNLVHIQNSFTAYSNFGVASFSINPEFDTVDILKKYQKDNGITNPNWHLMTGDREKTYKLANEGFNLYTAAGENFIDGFEHSGYFALVDKDGYLRCRKDQFGNPKIYYRGSVNHIEKLDSNGESEEISILKEDILKLLNE